MFITHFNRFFERHGRWMYGLLGILIASSFVFFVTPGKRGAWSKSEEGPSVGTMYGEPIAREDFSKWMTAADISVFLQWGQFLSQNDRMFGYLMQETLKRTRSLREAARLGLDRVSDEEVTETIRSQRRFQREGRFDRELFLSFKDNILKRRGLDGQDFDNIVRENIMIERLDRSIAGSAFVAPAEVRAEFDREKEKFTIKYREWKYFEVMKEAALEPSDEEVEAYFKEHRAELRLPDPKRIRIAAFTAELFMDKVEVPEHEMRSYYDRTKKRLYEPKKKKFEDVKKEIEDRLRRQAARRKANEEAKQFARKLGEIRGQTPDKAATDIFGALCGEHKIEPKDGGPFTQEDKEIAEIGRHPRLQREAYELNEAKPFSAPIYDAGTYYIACWLETIPGEPPEELTDSVKKDVKARILKDEAREFYKEKVEVYRERLAEKKAPEKVEEQKTEDGAEEKKAPDEVEEEEAPATVKEERTPDKLKEEYAKELEAMTDKSEEEKEEMRTAHDEDVRNYLTPYFVPVQRKARVVTFKSRLFRPKAVVKDEAVREQYDQDSAKYQKEEVRVREVLIRLPDKADEKQKEEKRKKAEDVLKQIREGRDFAELVTLYSDDPAAKAKGGDLGWFGRSDKPEIGEAAFALEKGQISEVIEGRSGYHVLKLADRREGRPFEEVKGEILKELKDKESERLAEAAALAFSDKTFAAIEKDGGKSAAAEVFGRAATLDKLMWKDTEWFRERGSVAPFGWQPALARDAHKLTEVAPLSEVIKGREDFYVACWLETKPSYLPDFDVEKGLPARVQNHVKRDKAKKFAREQAAAAHEELGKKLAAGVEFAEAAAELKLEEKADFTRNKPPSGVADGQKILEKVLEHAAGTLLPLMETSNGAALVYLAERVIPTDEEFEKEKANYASRLQRQKEGAALMAYHKRLEEASDTKLGDEWAGGPN